VQRHVLKNGIEVVLRPSKGVPAVGVMSSVHVGSRNDPRGYEGLAHYVEHLTFRPVPGFPPVFDLYEEAGASGVNATTTPDTTDYFAIVPTAQLERALWIEARRLAMGVDLVSEQPAQLERQVLLREHAMHYGKGVRRESSQAVYSALFPSGHPYRQVVATQESQEGLTISDARWFFARHYRPDRVRLVLVGDFDPSAALALAERWFGALSAKGDVPAAPAEQSDACSWAKQPPQLSAHRLRVETASKNESLNVYWPIPATEEPEQWRGLLDFVAQRLRAAGEETGLASNARVELVRGELGHYYSLTMPLAPAQPFEKAEPLLKSVLEDVRKLDKKELEAAAQSMDLWSRTGERGLLYQMRQLAQRQCSALACIKSEAKLAASTLGQLQRFDLSQALIVEYINAPNAPLEGDVEVVQ
jgi:predicted Zn-dependent peptidase